MLYQFIYPSMHLAGKWCEWTTQTVEFDTGVGGTFDTYEEARNQSPEALLVDQQYEDMPDHVWLKYIKNSAKQFLINGHPFVAETLTKLPSYEAMARAHRIAYDAWTIPGNTSLEYVLELSGQSFGELEGRFGPFSPDIHQQLDEMIRTVRSPDDGRVSPQV